MGLKPHISTITVATAGTKVQVNASSTYITSAYFEAQAGNTGSIYLGDSGVSSSSFITALSPGQGFAWTVDIHTGMHPSTSTTGPELQLNTIYVDASTSGNKVQVTYQTRIDNA